jgi:hypothetical protein
MKASTLLQASLCAAAFFAAGQAAAQTDSPAPKTPEPKVEVLKTADDSVQIEELRVRGVTQSANVKPRGLPAYEVSNTQGVRTWRLFTF